MKNLIKTISLFSSIALLISGYGLKRLMLSVQPWKRHSYVKRHHSH